MKKLIFVFVALFILVLISGCNARTNKTVHFDGNQADITSDEVSGTDTEKSDSTSTVAVKEVKKPSGKLEILSFDGAFLKTNLNYHLVEGGTTTDTYSIKINDYQLQKYIPGQTKWDYISSTKYNTLNSGWNNYIVKTFDKNGKQIDSLIFSIDFTPVTNADELPGVGSSHLLLLLFSLIMSSAYFTIRKLRWL